ncbi:MAG TPA: sialidase family protein, partial [Spirillospora sp.]|nr:sialidase family protein [Spirillospora sp.]
ERYIAIDNVCAWPNLTLMPDGAIIATIFNQPTHGGWQGDVECWASEDGGLTWQRRGTPAPHEPNTNRMNVAAGLAQDNDLIVLAAGWSNRPPVTEPAKVYFADSEILAAWVCRSSDGGRTWDRSGRIDFMAGLKVLPMPFGDIVHLPDGTLGVSLYGRDAVDPADGISAHLYVSQDQGRSWQHRSVIGAKNYNETNLLVLNSGRLLAAARTWDDHHLEIFYSDDSGMTWTAGGNVSLAGQHPAHLLELNDGRVLLVYGLRNPGLYGVAARFSNDGGRTWGLPHVLVDLGGSKIDCGYPASVQLKDGTLVTAYYASAASQHQRYHMGVLRWQPPE